MLLKGKIQNIAEAKIFLGNGYITNLEKIIAEIYPHKKCLILTDRVISEALKLKVSNIKILEKVKAKYELSLSLARQLKTVDFVVAIGSGTINDLVKFAAFKANVPYIVFATAPSMNGYLSANASLLKDVIKQSFAARLPEYAFFDLEILSKAPKRLIQSGIGDSICSSTCRADWLLSHYLIGTKYKEEYFANIVVFTKELFANISDIFTSKEKIKLLTKILIYSGINMTRAGGSYPASQGEHMIAHLIESKDKQFQQKYHGEQIAITTYYMAKLQESFLELAENEISFKETEYFNNNINIKNWQMAKERIKENFLSSKDIKAVLQKTGLSYKPENEVFFQEYCCNAYKTRDRFTFLNLTKKKRDIN